MASTYDISPTYQGTAFQNAAGRLHTVVIDVNFATNSTLSSGLAQNETLTLWELPASCTLMGAKIKVTTAQSDISDVDLGYSTDGSTNDGLLDGVSLVSTGYVYTAGIAAILPLAATNYLVFTNKDAQTISTAIFKVIVTYLDETA